MLSNYLYIVTVFCVLLEGQTLGEKVQSTRCTIPPHPEFGSYKYGASLEVPIPGREVNEFTFLRFECNIGYILSSIGVTFCYAGQWRNNIPICLKTCDPLKSLSINYECSNNNETTSCNNSVAPGTIARAECQKFYKSAGVHNDTITCKENGNWERSNVTCHPVTCEKILSNSSLRYTYFHNSTDNEAPVGTLLQVECDYGYKAISREVTQNITCKEDGSWEESRVQCLPVTCKKVVKKSSLRYKYYFDNAPLSSTIKEVPIGTVAQVQCDYGYRVTSKEAINNITCKEDSSWEESTVQCRAEDTLCKPLWSESLSFSCFFEDAPINCDRNALPGTILVPRCEEPYEPPSIGLNNVTCKEDGRWEDIEDECELTEFCFSLDSDDLLIYSYKFNGEDIDPDVSLLKVGTNATVKCRDNYKPVHIDSDVITCLEDGTWTKSQVECRSGSCKILWSNSIRYELATTGEEFHVFHPRNPGTTVKVTCKENYKARGIESDIITCTEDAIWEKSLIECLPEFCDSFSSQKIIEAHCFLNDTEVNCKDKGKLGTVAKVICPENTTRYGPDHITCQDNGRWDDVEVYCKEAEVEPKVKDDHKTASGDCEFGYFPVEIPNEPVQCIPAYCNSLNSNIFKFSCFREQVEVNCLEPMLVGTTATVECQDNLINVGVPSANITCMDEFSKWTESNLICTKVTCKPLFSTSLMYTCYYKDEELDCKQPMPYGAVAVTECKEHYLPKDVAVGNITCKDSGFWNVPEVKCTPECAGELFYEEDQSIFGNLPNNSFQYVAAIYENLTHNVPVQRGSGTIVSAKFVITNCLSFWTFGHGLNLTAFIVSYGLKHNKWQHPLDIDVKYSPVKRFLPHPKFSGQYKDHSYNIAVVELLHVIQFNSLVKPACIQWNEAQDHKITTPGTKAIMSNWKITTPSMIPDDELRSTIISTISTDECEKIIMGNVSMKENMFCGEILNGSICVSDIGAGLTVLEKFQNRGVYVLKAMFSHVAVIAEETYCNANQIAFFSKLSDHAPWLRSLKLHIEPAEFKCESGEIIIADAVCDGVNDCIDGSDEKLDSCINKDIFGLESRVSKGNGSCIAPPQLRNGQYFLSSTGLIPEIGSIVDINEKIVFKCNHGFELSKSDDSICINGDWVPTIPRCLKTCAPLKAKNVQYTCFVNATTERSCNERVPAGTEAFIRCNLHYKPLENIKSFICDENGSWGRSSFDCVPECGRLSNGATNLIINGNEAEVAETPWNVAIYKNEKGWNHICGGSLININVILSAAHCFWDWKLQKGLNSKLFAVGLGKVYRDWHHPNDTFAVYSKVKKLIIHPDYKGIKSKYSFDLAIIFLADLLDYSTVIKPVCVEWNYKGYMQEAPKDVIGKVVGWGQTEFGIPSSKLKQVNLPAVLRPECQSKSRDTFKDFLTFDKICAGFLDGSNVCKGDSGAGLCFPQKSNEDTLYYLRGIVSITDIYEKTCNAKLYAAYTDVLSHLTWMHGHNVTKEPDVFRCKSGNKISNEFVCDNEPDCGDESDEDFQLCSQQFLTFLNSNNLG